MDISNCPTSLSNLMKPVGNASHLKILRQLFEQKKFIHVYTHPVWSGREIEEWDRRWSGRPKEQGSTPDNVSKARLIIDNVAWIFEEENGNLQLAGSCLFVRPIRRKGSPKPPHALLTWGLCYSSLLSMALRQETLFYHLEVLALRLK